MSTPENDPVLRDRVARLMGVLRQIAVAKSRPVRHANQYIETLWLSPAHELGLVHPALEPGEQVVRVPRVPNEREPGPPPSLRNWVEWVRDGGDDLPAPTLKQHVDALRGPVHSTDYPRLEREFAAWTRVWRSWAERERVRRPRRRLYDKLFELQREAVDRPESVELVLSTGLLHAPGGQEGVHVHLVTQSIVIEQDAVTGDMVCSLADESAPRLEADELLSGLPLFDQSSGQVMRDRLRDTVQSVLDPAVEGFLKEWSSRALLIEHVVDNGWDRPAGSAARMALAPAVVARRRGAFALRQYYDTITRSLARDDTPVPLGLAQLVQAIEPEERLRWLERTGSTAAVVLAEEPLFPLPANEEQAQILERLGGDSGVVVEGPPGTGKTHTIANLVSALLARGQRVLVTSEKAQALRVLRDKLPEPMRDLCVALTDASTKGDSDLARSVNQLAGRKADFNPTRAEREIADLAARRRDALTKRADLLERIRALRESETYVHPEIAPGYRGTLTRIVETVNAEEEHAWVPAPAAGPLPLNGDEFAELVDLLRDETPERAGRRGQVLPAADELPGGGAVDRYCDAVARGDAARAGEAGGLVQVLGDLDGVRLAHLGPACAEVSEAIDAVRRLPSEAAWALSIIDGLLTGGVGHLWERAAQQLGRVEQAVADDHEAGFADVQVASGILPGPAAGVFRTFVDYLDGGGALRKKLFRSDEQKAVAAYDTSVLVDGAPVRSAGQARAAAAHLRVMEAHRVLDAAFAPLRLTLVANPHRGVLVERMRQVRHACSAVNRVVTACGQLAGLLLPIPVGQRPRVDSLAAAETIARTALAVSEARVASLARVELDEAAQRVLAAGEGGRPAPEVEAVAAALRGADAAAYRHAVAALADARDQHEAQLRADELCGRLDKANRPLAEELRRSCADRSWSSRGAHWPRAWARACAVTWVDRQATPGLERVLDAQLDVLVRDISLLTAELAAAKAWLACLSRMTAVQVQALQSYRSAKAGEGKGTGKYAERFRSSAREAMVVAQAAVPAWVMPIQQVLASIPPTQEAFDVVIVDEASQAELTSAFLLWLAPRVIVVGDDKQCTPSEVASGSLEEIFKRIDTDLSDIPSYLRTEFTPRSSVFSMLRTRFGQVVRLREHFRCMPEIITWSSNEFYRDAPLVPVRQFGADRLPPLRTTYVRGGYSEGANARLVNRPEAAAIAESVAACLDDPAYEGRTFGVVVLQGQSQVELIQQELIDRITPAQWDERRLRIGTPPDFQGDERNVVWLSLVVGPEQNFASLTRREFQQRFNVAASRAQDQLWLFHSVTTDRLRAGDLRHSLLTYLSTAGSVPVPPMPTAVDPDNRHPDFDSLFEQRVFLDITARGYHVTPQVETNGRRIDLVVTGAAGKLAVECDGDAFHSTPEQRSADLQREQELKRCGWTFWRVRGSTYYLDRVAALAPLWETLDRLGIGPIGSGVGDGTPTATVWTPTALDRPRPAHPDTGTDDPEDDTAAGFADARTAEPVVAEPVVAEPVVEEPALTESVVAQPALTEQAVVESAVAEPIPSGRHVADDRVRDLLVEESRRRPLLTEDVCDLLGVDTTTARDVLNALVNTGALLRSGSPLGASYRPAEQQEAPVADQPEDPRLDVVRRLASRVGGVGNAGVRDALGISAGEAQLLLRALYEAGQVDRIGSKGARVYRRRR
ncbi:very-short-patch-repair endonuclease [Saccharothrix ecbatanensis]|uniref:Very-short-patch-repair endonuclease n=1 Tax=Saccharothrix ecbatanensis TaxID=1105145 RepID=A0A7W9HUZ7_9PSEU|nr:AAA domain-containing protein [Saccharothrix ecbatanensis]MBB5808696.1 very-short-patch-repair endonuclease [Saccharothrix ecbatanensis]